jgi:hypothetical protein
MLTLAETVLGLPKRLNPKEAKYCFAEFTKASNIGFPF